MTKLYLNTNSIENSLYNINFAIDNLNKAIYYSNSLKIPNDFEYLQYLKQLCSKTITSRDSLVSKKQILEQSVSKYKKIEKENSDKFSEISILNITTRHGFKK
jgi:hypothetical protein